MNRAFLIVLVPAILVVLAYLLLGWGYAVSAPVAMAALVLAGALVVWRRRKRPSADPR